MKKINNINQIDDEKIREQLKIEFKDENDINYFLKIIDFSYHTLEKYYLEWNSIKESYEFESKEYNSFKMTLIDKKAQRQFREIDLLKKIILNEEKIKLGMLISKGKNLVANCDRMVVETDIAVELGYASVDDLGVPEDYNSFKFDIGDVLKETYLYANELFLNLFFLGNENDVSYDYIDCSGSHNLEDVKKELCFNDSEYIELIIKNLSMLPELLELINDIKSNYDNIADYAGWGGCDVSTYRYIEGKISKFQDAINSLIENLKICLKPILPYYEKMENLKSKWYGNKYLDIFFN